MSTAAVESIPWRRGRWWLVVGLIFAAHLGLIFALGDRRPTVTTRKSSSPQLHLATLDHDLLALDDPTLFVRPHINGFSGTAWMRTPRLPVRSFKSNDPSGWLPLPVEQLGGVFSHFMETNAFARFSPGLKAAPQFSLPDVEDFETATVTNSIVRVEGDLDQRKLLNPPQLPAEVSAEMLAPSEVQVLVDDAGHVISTTLLPRGNGSANSATPLPPGSGSKEADQRALNVAKALRFAPLPRQSSGAAVAARSWTRGKIVVQWSTAPLASTNSPATTP